MMRRMALKQKKEDQDEAIRQENVGPSIGKSGAWLWLSNRLTACA